MPSEQWDRYGDDADGGRPGTMTGTVVLSIEVELGWGLARLPGEPTARHSSGRVVETETLRRLLSLCDDLDLPITFDVVGHLLLESCSGTHAGNWPADWFRDDPGTSVDEDPLYYAPDLVDLISDAAVDHEIATHTFSHARCDEVNEDVVDEELRTTRDIHRDADRPLPSSFVPPLHGPPPTSVLRDRGIGGVREPVVLRPPIADPDRRSSFLTERLRRIRQSHPVQVLYRRHPVRDPVFRDELVRHYTTWHASLTAPYLPNGTRRPHSFYRFLPIRVRQRIHERYLLLSLADAAVEEGCVHLWTHLFNLSNDAQWPPVESFLHRLADRRTSDELTVETMASLTEAVRGAHV